jgi:protein disulfide-isomerase
MKIEIWSDIMCPFCYIGKRNFESALKQFAHAEDLVIEWKSFQLDPAMAEVPFFVVDRKYAIVGAQPPAVILQTLEMT